MRCQEPPPLHELRRLSVVRAAAARTSLAVCGLFESIRPRPRGRFFGYLTSPLDQIASMHRRLRRVNSNHIPDGTFALT